MKKNLVKMINETKETLGAKFASKLENLILDEMEDAYDDGLKKGKADGWEEGYEECLNKFSDI